MRKEGLTAPRPKVSVVVPVYNAERFLVDTLENVLTQDLGDFEVVCVDNGSTDRSADIVCAFARDDARVRLVRQPQAGPGAARNRGIDEACGRFITFLDADDWYEEPGYLSALYWGAVDSGLCASGGCMVNWWGPDNVERNFARELFFDGYEFTHDEVVAWRDWQFDFGFTRFMFARELFEGDRHRFGGLSFFEDPLFLVRILDEAGSFFATNRAHYVYRLNRQPRLWTQRQALDLVAGVCGNLEFSRERGLEKLHSYTAHHFDFFVEGMDIGDNPLLSTRKLDRSLRKAEAVLSNQLLEQAGDDPEWLPFEFLMRKRLEEDRARSVPRRAYWRLRYGLRERERIMNVR